jgi:hypothetical protein
MEKAVSFRYCSRFLVSTVHPRREINELAKPVATSRESAQRANQTPVVVNHSGLIEKSFGERDFGVLKI